MTKTLPSPETPPENEGVSVWHSTLWSMIGAEVQTLSGFQVVEALRSASEEVYAAGLDHRFAKLTGFDQFEDRALAFDITWLSVFMLKLAATNEPDPLRRAQRPTLRDYPQNRELTDWLAGV